jgi:hypothetical protein
MPAARECSRDLKEQGRFADSRIAAKEQHRSANKAAASDPIELGDAGGKARRLVRRPLQGLDGERTTLAHWPPRTLGAFLDECVPLAAGFALARPARESGPAILANKILRARRHLTAPVIEMTA